MTVALVVGVLAFAAAIAVRATWRITSDERQSVRHHQNTLETLRHMSDRGTAASRAVSRDRGSSSGALRRADAHRRPASGPNRAPVAHPGANGNGSHRAEPSRRSGDRRSWLAGKGAAALPSSDALTATTGAPEKSRATRAAPASPDVPPRPPLVFDDETDPSSWSSATRPLPVDSDASPAMSEQASVRAEAVAHDASAAHDSVLRPSPSPALTVAAVLAAVAALSVALSFALASVHARSPHAATAHKAAGHVHRAASSAVITPATATSSSATYVAPHASYTVTLDASGPCWVMATDARSGAVVWTGTLSAGDRRPLPVTGGLVVRLGSSTVAISLNGAPVELPSGFRAPFDMRFQPA
jgi:hypothetical protein